MAADGRGSGSEGEDGDGGVVAKGRMGMGGCGREYGEARKEIQGMEGGSGHRLIIEDSRV